MNFSFYVDGHDWEQGTLETPMFTRSTTNPAPRETRKREQVPINTDIDLDPKFHTFRIFLRGLLVPRHDTSSYSWLARADLWKTFLIMMQP
jgi:hypothetical protein